MVSILTRPRYHGAPGGDLRVRGEYKKNKKQQSKRLRLNANLSSLVHLQEIMIMNIDRSLY